jgi:hypothetical protein
MAIDGRTALVLAMAVSAGAHAALAPVHAAEAPLAGLLFGASAVALTALAVLVDRSGRRGAIVASALLLGALLALYVLSRVTVVWPLEHAEPVDAIGVITKLCETTGLVLALGLVEGRQRQRRRDAARPTEGAVP